MKGPFRMTAYESLSFISPEPRHMDLSPELQYVIQNNAVAAMCYSDAIANGNSKEQFLELCVVALGSQCETLSQALLKNAREAEAL